MAEPAVRLLVVAHGPTAAASELVFGDAGPLLRPPSPVPLPTGISAWGSGPEQACRETVAALGGAAEVLPALAGPEFAGWAGRTLGDVAAADPAGLQAWLADPDTAPHGGETLNELVDRLQTLLTDYPWFGRTAGVVVAPLVARALTVAALGAPASVIGAVDVGYGGRVLLSRSGSRWRLQELLRRPGSS